MDFSNIRQQVFEQLQRTNSCHVLSSTEIQRLQLTSYEAVWQITIELALPGEEVCSIEVYLGLPYEFPLLVPTVYLTTEAHQRLGYILHVNTQGNVCIFDTETTVVHPDAPDAPYQIVRQCLQEARRLLEREYSRKASADYQPEIIAYWEDRYHTKDTVETGLLVIEGEVFNPHQPFTGYLLKPTLSYFTFVVHQAGEQADLFKQFLVDRDFTVEEHPIFYVGELPALSPPFYWKNRDVLQLIEHHFPSRREAYCRYLDKSQWPIALFSTVSSGRSVLMGWKHQHTGVRKGFRTKGLLSEAVQTYAQADPVTRIMFETLSQERLQLRTNGQKAERTFRFGVAGLGSVGSHLIQTLSSFPVQQFRLVDPEPLRLENVNRHLLGLTAVGQPKANALANYLREHNPLRSVDVRTDTVVKVMDREPDFLSEMDALFVAIGKNTIEQYIVSKQQEGTIPVPVFIFWIEPYATAGHLVYLPIGSRLAYADLFTDGYYRYNAVSVADYEKQENRFLLKEAGCQTSYLPYSQEYVTLFLARLFPEIRRLLMEPSPGALAFTWLGNVEAVRTHGLNLSSHVLGKNTGDLLITDLE